MWKRTHRVEQHKSAVTGIEAMTLLTDHAFPRHSHDSFGIGSSTLARNVRGAASGRSSPDPAIRAGIVAPEQFEAGIRALFRTAEPDGIFSDTFFKATGRKA